MALEMKGLRHRGARRLLLAGDDDGYEMGKD
jgi:guanyl-specific ribonuclease Sa